MCRGVSSPAADSIPGTLWLKRNFASPVRPVRAGTSTKLSAFRSLKWSLKTPYLAMRPRGLPGVPLAVSLAVQPVPSSFSPLLT
jgi:hypothetical protein